MDQAGSPGRTVVRESTRRAIIRGRSASARRPARRPGWPARQWGRSRCACSSCTSSHRSSTRWPAMPSTPTSHPPSTTGSSTSGCRRTMASTDGSTDWSALITAGRCPTSEQSGPRGVAGVGDAPFDDVGQPADEPVPRPTHHQRDAAVGHPQRPRWSGGPGRRDRRHQLPDRLRDRSGRHHPGPASAGAGQLANPWRSPRVSPPAYLGAGCIVGRRNGRRRHHPLRPGRGPHRHQACPVRPAADRAVGRPAM